MRRERAPIAVGQRKHHPYGLPLPEAGRAVQTFLFLILIAQCTTVKAGWGGAGWDGGGYLPSDAPQGVVGEERRRREEAREELIAALEEQIRTAEVLSPATAFPLVRPWAVVV